MGPFILPEPIFLAAEEETYKNYQHDGLEHHLNAVDFLEVELLVDEICHVVISFDVECLSYVLTYEILLVKITYQFEPKLEVEWKLVWEQNENV